MATNKQLAEAREANEAQVLAVTKKCRGPYVTDAEEQAEGFDEWRGIEGVDEKAARALITRLEERATELAPTGMAVAAPPVGEGDWEGLKRAAFPLIRLRGDRIGRGCGWDLNEEIIKHPFDGGEHVTECPNCGISISWKAPVFDEGGKSNG